MARVFLFLGLLLGLTHQISGQSLELPALPYDYSALEPSIDETTMMLHHMGHHKAYLATLNQALAALRAESKTKHLAKMGIDTLLQHLDEVPEALRTAVRNGGGGFVNHDLFWKSLAPEGSPQNAEPRGNSPLGKAIARDFGSLLELQNAFNTAAAKVFGSGWAWVVVDNASGKLSVMSTPNQDTPGSTRGVSVLFGLDVWEHAYYLKYQNKRAEYISAFWKIINWEEAAARHMIALAKGKREL